jgi:AcrR family transcriptional regulator
MPFSCFARMPSERREHLLTLAAREFAAHGFEGASLNRILAAAHIGKSSAYYYFEDKADLFCTTVGYCLDRLQLAPAGEVFATLTAETFWTTLAEIHAHALLRARQQPWLFGAVRAADHLAPESLQQASLAGLVRSLAHYQLTGMGATVQRGQDLELIRSDLPNGLLVAWFQAIDNASDDWLLAQLDTLDEAAIGHISRQTMAAIRQALAPPSLPAYEP